MTWCAACGAAAVCAACGGGCVTCAGCGGCLITPTPDIEVAITGVTSGAAAVAGVGAVAGVVAW